MLNWLKVLPFLLIFVIAHFLRNKRFNSDEVDLFLSSNNPEYFSSDMNFEKKIVIYIVEIKINVLYINYNFR